MTQILPIHKVSISIEDFIDRFRNLMDWFIEYNIKMVSRLDNLDLDIVSCYDLVFLVVGPLMSPDMIDFYFTKKGSAVLFKLACC